MINMISNHISIYILTILTFIFLSGCATLPPPNTPSGNPEVTLRSVRGDCVRSGFLNEFVNQGYSIHSSNDTQLVAGRRTKKFGATIAYGTKFGGAPEERVTVLFIPQGEPETIRVVVTAAYVSNQGTAFEKITPVQPTQMDQDKFTEAKTRIEYACQS